MGFHGTSGDDDDADDDAAADGDASGVVADGQRLARACLLAAHEWAKGRQLLSEEDG